MKGVSAWPVVSTFGERVIIIGYNVEGAMDMVGYYGEITQCPYNLVASTASVAVTVPGLAWYVMCYFVEKLLCRSTSEPVEWTGLIIY
jgi:hypothetical protein